MEKNPYFEETFWFTRVLETEEYKYDEIKKEFSVVDKNIYVSLQEILEKREIINEENPNSNEDKFTYLIKIASESKLNGSEEFSNAYNKLFNRDLPKDLENCFINHSEIYNCLNVIFENDTVIRIDFNQIFNWIGEYIDLFIMLELINDILPSKRGRHLNQIDTELRDYSSVRSKYLSNEEDINLSKYKKFRNYNFHWSNNHKVRPEMISNLMSDLFSEKINRIDNFYLPAIIKQIWFIKQINDRRICSVIMPIIKLLKSIDKRSSHRNFHTTESEFKNDPILSERQMFSSYEEYCYAMINRLVKTNQ